jgi:hypothetical protein
MATLDKGLWTKNTEGNWINKGRDKVPGSTDSGRHVKYTTYLRADLDQIRRVPSVNRAFVAI